MFKNFTPGGNLVCDKEDLFMTVAATLSLGLSYLMSVSGIWRVYL